MPGSREDPGPLAPLLRAFDREGVVHLKGFLEGPLLRALQADVTGHLERLRDRLPLSGRAPGPPGVGWIRSGASTRIIRVDGLVEQNALPSVLALIGSPALESTARSLAEDAIITQADLVVRHRHDGHVIAWHQDAVYARTHRMAALGLALEDTEAGDGDLLTLPGTQTSIQDLCALEDAHGFAPPGLRRIAPRAGDLVIHDAMLVHGSLPLIGRPLRRTLYLYVDSATRILGSEPGSAAWVAWREDLWTSARAAWRAFSDGDPAWRGVRWPASLQAPKRAKPRTLAGNYCLRQDGNPLGNTSEFFARDS